LEVKINMKLPVIEEMEIYPVAGHDSMLLNLSGAQGPFFTRNVVILHDSTGNVGLGEVPGGEKIKTGLEKVRAAVLGSSIADYRNTLKRCQALLPQEGDVRGEQTFDLRTGVHVITAVEAALLDLWGKYTGLAVCDLLGEGRQRDKVKVLGYLFYVADSAKTDLPYLREDNSGDEWYRIRRQPAMTPEAIVKQAEVSQKKYGFQDFKLKGGVFSGKEEMKAICAMKERFPKARFDLDPNGGWLLKDAVELVSDMHGTLSYCEDPCGAEGKFSGREIMAEFKRLTGFPTATNMIDTDWREMANALIMQAVDIPLADCHFWTLEGAVRVGQICQAFNFTWGSHSNNHFDISLAQIAHTAAAVPGRVTAVDTHWIWQEGAERLTKEPPVIKDGCIAIPDKPGLGVEPDMERIKAANKLYQENCLGARDDAKQMQYLIPGWKFNPKKPAMLR
jgi:glucarate dehydratase